jgi:hypothetical protein
VESKNLSFTLRLSGHFFNRREINSLLLIQSQSASERRSQYDHPVPRMNLKNQLTAPFKWQAVACHAIKVEKTDETACCYGFLGNVRVYSLRYSIESPAILNRN